MSVRKAQVSQFDILYIQYSTSSCFRVWYNLPGVSIPKCFQSCINVRFLEMGRSVLLGHIGSTGIKSRGWDIRTVNKLQIHPKTRVAGYLFQGASRTHNPYSGMMSVPSNLSKSRWKSPTAEQYWRALGIFDRSGLNLLADTTKDAKCECSKEDNQGTHIE